MQKTKTNDSRLSPGWNHIVYTFGKENDQVLSKLYLNGEVVNVAKPKWTQSLSMQNTIIGCFRTKAHSYFGGINGKLDELIIGRKTSMLTQSKRCIGRACPCSTWNRYLFA